MRINFIKLIAINYNKTHLKTVYTSFAVLAKGLALLRIFYTHVLT
jgi:hypothetical protein